ncbi:50S ribosomal protein L20 [candidate division WWE3 bacterium]|nr:50S ribosomal protein L20 [candidate division WWE3 bacterium]
MRVKKGTTRARKHREIKSEAKGFIGHRRRTIKGAKEGIMHSLKNAFVGRKDKKANMRALWIIRINAILSEKNISYSRFIKQLKDKNIILNRKILSEIAVQDPATFDKIIKEVA